MVVVNGRGIAFPDGRTPELASVPRGEGFVLALDRDEFAALTAAVEVAFDDVGAIPEGMRPAADALWAATHAS